MSGFSFPLWAGTRNPTYKNLSPLWAGTWNPTYKNLFPFWAGTRNPTYKNLSPLKVGTRKPTHKISISLIITVVSILSAGPVAGQSLCTRLEGVVQDAASGIPVENARVEVNAGEYVCLTNPAGRFAFDHLPLGECTVAASRLGYVSSGPLRVVITEDVSQTVLIRLQPHPIELPGQRVTGSRPVDQFTEQSTVVLTGEQIRKAGYHDLPEALAALPGITVNPGYSASGTQEVTVRGETGKRIAVTLDGVPLADGVRGSADLSAIPVSAVDRIEVHREGAWGDGAIGGAVRITTRRTFPNEQSLSTGYGSFDRWQLSATTSSDFRPGFGGLISAELSGSGSRYTFVNEARRDSTRGNAGHDVQKVFARVGGRATARGEWGISALFHEHDRGAPGALHLSTPDARIEERRRLITGDAAGRINRALSLSLQTSVSQFRTHYLDSVTFPAHSQFDEMTGSLRLTMAYDPHPGSFMTAAVGGELERQELEGVNSLDPTRSFGRAGRSFQAAWGELSVRSPEKLPELLGAGQITAGLRYDHDAQMRGYWAPRAGFGWGWGQPRWFGVHTSWGRAFHRPLLTSLFWKQDAFSSGNPELRPETSREWDAGIELRSPKTGLSMSTNFLDRVCDGFIEWEKRYGGVWSPVNMPRAALVGREDGVSWSAFNDRLSVDFFHSLLWATDQSPDRNYRGKFLLFRPKHTYQLKIQSVYHGLDVRADARWVDKRYTRKQNTKWLPSYRWFDLAIRQAVSWAEHRVIVSLKGENLTNEPVALLEGYPLPGRSLWLGLELRW